MSKSRQADIASFFTRQPKPAGAGKSEAAGSPNENAGPSDVAAAKPAPKRKPEQVRRRFHGGCGIKLAAEHQA